MVGGTRDSVLVPLRLEEMLKADIEELNDLTCEAAGADVSDIAYELSHVENDNLYVRAHFTWPDDDEELT